MTNNINNVLVIGGAGYIGSVLTRQLMDQGYKTTVFDRLLFGDESVVPLEGSPYFRFVQADIRDIAAVSQAVKGQDAVILLAALVGEPACDRDPDETVDVNYLATRNVVEACKYHGVQRLLFASTDSCYGIQEGILYEDSPLNPISLYAELKVRMEDEILSLNGSGPSATILRLATVYGLSPRMRFDLIINILTMHAVKNQRIRIFGGKQWRPLVHVADVGRGFLTAMETDESAVRGQVFNIGSNDQNYQIGELGQLVAREIPDIEIDTVNQPPDLRDYHVNFDKAEKIMGYKAQLTVADGIHEIETALTSGAIKDPNDSKYRNA
jgi:nucleoside-diphosphate-sugar epimerase